jgi:hypothetical protein
VVVVGAAGALLLLPLLSATCYLLSDIACYLL